MRWIRRHPIATAVFAVLFLFFVLVGIFGEAEDSTRSEVILGLVLIYLIIVALYAVGAWIYGKAIGGAKREAPPPMGAFPWAPPEMLADRPPGLPQQMFPQWDWSEPTPATCWRCGSVSAPAAAFCEQCGARLATAAPVAPPPGAIQCPRCRTMLSPQVRFCTNCGLPRRAD